MLDNWIVYLIAIFHAMCFEKNNKQQIELLFIKSLFNLNHSPMSCYMKYGIKFLCNFIKKIKIKVE